MSSFKGLNSCGTNFTDFCITKSIEFALSVILFGATLYQLCVRIQRERTINFFVVVSLQMQTSLLCNILFCWLHTSYFLYDIQVFGFSIYFITIVYQVALRLVQKSIRMKKIHWAVVHGVFLIYICANVTALILRLTYLYHSTFCNQIWVLIIDALGIVLSICMVVGGLKYQRIQKQKVSDQHLKNPMPSMWKWIGINIGCQILDLGQSLYLQFSPQENCTFSSNIGVQSSMNLFFDVFSYHLAIFATFWFLRKKFQQAEVVKRNSLRKDSLGDQTNAIELVITRFSQLQ